MPKEAPTPRVIAIRYLRDLLQRDHGKAGDFLSSERELALAAGVSRFTLHQAMEDLHREAVIAPAGGSRRGWRRVHSGGASGTVDTETVVVISDWRAESLNAMAQRSMGALLAGLTVSAERHALRLLHLPTAQILAAPRVAHRGVIVLHPATQLPTVREQLHLLHARGVPITVQDETHDADPHMGSVASHHYHGGVLLATWLAQRGCQRVLRVADPPDDLPEPTWLRLRYNGLLESGMKLGLADAGSVRFPLPIDGSDFATIDVRIRIVESHIRERLTADPAIDAIVCLTDRTALLVGAALRRLKHFRQLTVTGYDCIWSESPEFMHGCPPPAVTITKRDQKIGEALIDSLVNGTERMLVEPLLMPCPLT